MNPRWVARRGQQQARRAARRLATLCRESAGEPLVAPVTNEAETKVVEAVVDSGAEDSVTPPGVFMSKVAPSVMSREGRRYRAANGSPIPNLGQTIVHFQDGDGQTCGLPFQVAEVDRPLISVSRLAAAGCKVTFLEDRGEILHVASGKCLPLVRRDGVYILELRVRSGRGGAPGGRKPASAPFQRQGR